MPSNSLEDGDTESKEFQKIRLLFCLLMEISGEELLQLVQVQMTQNVIKTLVHMTD